MKRPVPGEWFCWLAFGLLVLVVAVAKAESGPAASSEYRLGTGDVIKIQVFEENDLSMEVRVGDTGRVSYPFLGELQVAGLSPPQLEALITRGLKGPYLVDPKVTVAIVEYRQFFVNGQVEKPGGYPFQPGLTVRKAVSVAGGFKVRAAKDKIFVIHDDDPSGRSVRVTQDDLVRPGDIITVEQSFF